MNKVDEIMEDFSTLLGIGLIFIFMGTVFFIIGWRTSRLIHVWRATKGVVIPTMNEGNFVFSDDGALPEDFPTVEYTVEGVTYQFTSRVSQKPRMPIGKEVEVLYNPEDHSQVIINTFVQNGTLFKLLGIIFESVGFILVVISFFDIF